MPMRWSRPCLLSSLQNVSRMLFFFYLLSNEHYPIFIVYNSVLRLKPLNLFIKKFNKRNNRALRRMLSLVSKRPHVCDETTERRAVVHVQPEPASSVASLREPGDPQNSGARGVYSHESTRQQTKSIYWSPFWLKNSSLPALTGEKVRTNTNTRAQSVLKAPVQKAIAHTQIAPPRASPPPPIPTLTHRCR